MISGTGGLHPLLTRLRSAAARATQRIAGLDLATHAGRETAHAVMRMQAAVARASEGWLVGAPDQRSWVAGGAAAGEDAWTESIVTAIRTARRSGSDPDLSPLPASRGCRVQMGPLTGG